MDEPFQPGGRAPAPAPLDLVQDFVNTEIPDWDRDDLGSPEALAAWLRARRADRRATTRSARSDFVAARGLRAALRELALANTLDEPPAAARREELDACSARFRSPSGSARTARPSGRAGRAPRAGSRRSSPSSRPRGRAAPGSG